MACDVAAEARAQQLIQAPATLDVNGCVARQLLAFAEKYGGEKNGATQIRIVLTQGDIADLVGASRKRVNQAMVLFKEQGLIDTDPEGRIEIKDAEGLARFCQSASLFPEPFVLRGVARK